VAARGSTVRRRAAPHLRRRATQAPRIRSDAPCVAARCGTGYISALSKKLMPHSAAASSSQGASASGVPSPNSMVPAATGAPAGTLS